MKKSFKLLSVLLTVLMIFSSVSVGASAAKASYQTVANLEAAQAYSPYGTVTRLSTEERVSILLDFLDLTLAPLSDLNMGEVFNVLGLKLSINLTSVDGLFKTVDDVKSLKGNFLYSVAAAIVNLGIVEDLVVNNNTWTSNMTRAGSAQLAMIENLLKLLSGNASVIGSVFDKGIQLGLISSFISGLDLKPINNLVTDLPGLINAIVLPLMGRQDDTQAQRDILSNKSSNLITVAQNFVYGLFTKPMSWTSYRVDAAGNDLGFTTALPTQAAGTSRYFVINGDEITQYDYKYNGVLDNDGGVWEETVTYTKSTEEEYAGSGTYLYKAPEGFEGDATLKWYKAEGVADNNGNIQSGYWLPSLKTAIENGLTIEINGADSVAGLLYKIAPIIFAEMAPVVLNGSVKKAVAEAFDVKFDLIGHKGDAELPAGEFFTKDQEYYTWEYSDYTVIDGVPYYRFQDDFYMGTVPTNISDFYGMINWDYKITGDFMNKYIPATVGGTSAAGYTHVLDALNDFVGDLINLFIADSWTVKGQTVTRADVFPWVAGGNDKAIENLKNCARNVFSLAPDEIVDEWYMDAQFYNAMMNGTTAQAVNGLICELVKLIMPQITFADNIVDQPMLAIGAVVVRELVTQLMPTYNFDAMIFSDYNNRTMIAGKSSDYWLDTVLYMGVNLGMYYLRNLADVGEDDATNGYYGVMANLGALPANSPEGMTFGANAQYVNGTPAWLMMVDWVIDWALATNVEWAWQMSTLIDCGSTVDLKTYQNPFNKLNTILLKLLPLDQLLNDSQVASSTYGSNTFVENILKGGLVDSITSLDLDRLQSCLEVPTGYFTQGNIADSLVKIIVNLLDNIFYKVAGNTDLVNKTKVTSVATLLNHANIKDVVVTLIGKLYAASNTYHVLQPVMPILNFFVGWTTDPQKYADPSIYFSNDWGSSYLKSDNVPVIKVTNASSGMLLKHRNSSTVDTAYSIQITGITFTGGISTTQKFPLTVNPGDTATIALSVPTTATPFKATISYKFTGKDGTALGGTQTQVSYAYVSDVADQLNENVDAVDAGDYWQRDGYKSYVFTNDIYTTVTEYKASASYKAATIQIGNKEKAWQSVKYDTAATAPMSTYFDLITNRAEAGWEAKLVKDSITSTSGYLWKAKSGVTADTDFPYGVYDGGQVALKYGSKSGTYIIDFIYYNDYQIGSVRDQYVGYALKASDFDDQTLFNAYEAALLNVVKLANIAMRTDYVTTIQPQIEPAIEALEDAYNALIASGSSSSSSTGDITLVKSMLASLETNPDRDINFQDYALFEYFKYENERTAARGMISSVTGPEAPKSYIPYEDASYDVIEAVVNDQASAGIKTGINANVVNPTSEDMENYRIALENYTPAKLTELGCIDQAAKLQYYYNFMAANEKAVDKTFLNKEIAYAVAQNYDEEIYSVDSWARYTKALADAQAIAGKASASESEVFDAKYELMVAQTALREAYKSIKDTGYLDRELNVVIEQAQNVIEYFGTYYKLADGVTAEEAWGELVWALGIPYDVNVDGKDYEGILFSRSATTFQAYDSTASIKNKRAVDNAADNLRAALKNFVVDVAVESTDAETVEQVDQDVRFIQGIVPGSITSIEILLTKVECATANTTLVGAANMDGMFGTGATVTVKGAGDVELAKYFVVIYGDVNGDGAVDGFDTYAVNKHMNHITGATLLNIYETAGDTTDDGIVNVDDYAQIKMAAAGYDAVSQTK